MSIIVLYIHLDLLSAHISSTFPKVIGYEDGIIGRSTIQLKGRREACAEYGVLPNLDVYLTGHRQGLMIYCRPIKAFHLGRDGHSHPTICPSGLEDELQPVYRDGVIIYQHGSSIKEVQQQPATGNSGGSLYPIKTPGSGRREMCSA